MIRRADTRAGHCVLACSPRKRGNTDLASQLLHHTLEEEMALPGQLWRVADVPVRPCIACGHCDDEPGHCAQGQSNIAPTIPSTGGQDQATFLLQAICGARVACLISPIYFYHFPAQAKALLDRSQCFRRLPGQRKPGRGGTLGVVLISGRPRGERLFQGALLTLRYAAQALGIGLAEPLLLRGLDEADDLKRRPDVQEKIRAYARALAPTGHKESKS